MDNAEMFKIVGKLNEFFTEENGGEAFYANEDFFFPWELHSCIEGYSYITYLGETIYKDWDNDRKIIKDDYEPLITYLIRQASKIGAFCQVDYMKYKSVETD